MSLSYPRRFTTWELFIMDNQLFLLLTARKLSGEASGQDKIDLENFFKEDNHFRKKYDLLKAHWESKNHISTDVDAAMQKIIVQIQQHKNESEKINASSVSNKKTGVIKYLLRFSKVAAILIVILSATYFIFNNYKPNSIYEIASKANPVKIQQTPKGSRSTIILSDGTKVIMNADTRLKYPLKFIGATREVYLTGEAFFDVAKNAKIPFIIHTDKINIKVLGTEFNVKSYPGDSTSETTLIRGLIEVTLKDRPDDRIILKPKEKLIVSNTSPGNLSPKIKATTSERSAEISISNLHYISRSDSAVVETSWVNNKLVFQDESFSKLAEDMGRKYDVNIQFLNNNIKNYRFTGIFEKETIEETLDALNLTEKFNYKMNGTTINIY